MKIVGILGGGQLGLLLAQSLQRYGATVNVYDPNPESPDFKTCNEATCDSWTDSEKLVQFFKKCDVVTYEFENVSVDLLEDVQAKSETALYPSEKILAITQNRILEKEGVQNLGHPVVPFAKISETSQIAEEAQKIAYPCILKTTTGGYDGKGQYFLKDDLSLNKVLAELPKAEFILEKAVNLKCEVSCIVSRNKKGQCVSFPIFENVHKDGILFQTQQPANISSFVKGEARKIAENLATKLEIVGLLTVEFFVVLDESDEEILYVNELAPRPHNSGHITLKSCSISQFDLHARALLDLYLETPILVGSKTIVMENLLGDVWNSKSGWDIDLKPIFSAKGFVDIVLYGKPEARPKRKMGHFYFMR